MIYLAVTSRTWPAWSAPDEDGNWQKIFQQHRATWKIFFAIFLLALSTFAVTPTTAQLPRWRSEEWSGWSELKSETPKIWKCQLSDEQEVKYEMKRRKQTFKSLTCHKTCHRTGRIPRWRSQACDKCTGRTHKNHDQSRLEHLVASWEVWRERYKAM